MNVLVIGCGRLGSTMAKKLARLGHDVAVVDNVEDNFHALGGGFDGLTVTGMPMDMTVLKNAGVESCDAVLVMTPDDNLNITVSEIVLEFFQVENVIARISDPRREDVFHRFGLKTVCQNNLAVDAIITAMTSPWDAKQVTFGVSTATFTSRPAEHGEVGSSVTMLEKSPGQIVFGVVRQNGDMELFDKEKRLVVEEGDHILFAEVSD